MRPLVWAARNAKAAAVSASSNTPEVPLHQAFAAEYAALRPGSDFSGPHTEALFDKVHHDPQGFSALCISGGGIRSATFALGVLQGLAQHGLLQRFDYLSTVSGGGYIGGWLTAWSHRAGGLDKVIAGLQPDARPEELPPDALGGAGILGNADGVGVGGDVGAGGAVNAKGVAGGTGAAIAASAADAAGVAGAADAPGGASAAIDPIGHLREYNSYMSPQLGAMSADTWTLAATILRNLLLNWLVLVPLLMAALMVPRLYLSLLTFPEAQFGSVMAKDANAGACGICCGDKLNYCDARLDVISASWAVDLGLPALMAVLFALALFNTLRYLPGVGDQMRTRRDFARGVLLPLVGAVLAYLAFDSLYYLGSKYTREGRWWVQVFGALLPCALAWLACLVWVRPPANPARPRAPRLRRRSLSLAVFVMAAGTGAAIWVAANFILPKLDWPAFVTLGPPVILLGFVLGSIAFVGLSSHSLQDEDREWMSRSMASMLMFCAAWVLVCGCVLVVPSWALQAEAWVDQAMAATAAFSAWASAFGQALMAGKARSAADTPRKAWTAAAIAIRAAPAVFIVALVIGLSLATDLLLTAARGLPGAAARPWLQVLAADGKPVPWSDHAAVLTQTPPALLAALLLALLALGGLAGRYININTFSLHGMYRERLVRAYLGASNARRRANPFTGFAHDDDIAMHALDARRKPLHVINLTLNLVHSSRLAWQQRKAQSFTVTPLHCGNFELGYRPSTQYGGPNGLSLGTAVAISGAAASPSMGAYSSPLIGFIMTLLNARLGAWLGNPGAAGANSWQEAAPRSAIHALAQEALGLTSNDNPYVYLSDGGHFENLGLYEMVLRRCRCIVVLDADCDPTQAFNNLGNAVRKLRIDLGISICFEDAGMQALREQRSRCAVARIGYSAVDAGAADGWLIYLKLMRRGNEPPDVENYFRSHPDFPHQSTGDQWFDESQTESYRMLGLHSMDELCAGWGGGSLDDFRQHLGGIYPANQADGRAVTSSHPVPLVSPDGKAAAAE